MRRFVWWRNFDHSGVSGVGPVADGILFPDLSVALRWRGNNSCTQVWDDLQKVEAVHGHGGDSYVVWIDPPPVADSRLTEYHYG